MKYTIITLLLLSFVLVSSITFDDAYANVNNPTRVADPQKITNDVNINYNQITHDVLVDWNFGVQDDRTCYSKTDFGIDYRDEKGELILDPFHTFFGTDITLYDVYGMFNTDIVNEDMAVISCEGDFTLNITDFQMLENFSGFEFWMTFYEKIDGKPQILNEVSMFYSEDRELIHKTCFANTSDLYTDIYYDTRKHWKIVADEANNNCHRSDEQYDDVIPVVYTPVGFIHYEDYPSHNTPNNTNKKNGGGSIVIVHPPTGYKDNQGNEIVKNGFVYNGVVTDLTGYHTPFDKIIVTTGLTNNITVKGFDNNGLSNIKWLQFGFGMPGVGSPLANAQSLVTVYFTNTEIGEIVIREDYPLIKIISISTEIVECGYVNYDCLQVSLDHIFLDQPKYDVVAVNWLDNYSYGQTYFVNDGVNVIGESLNEPLISKVSVGKGGAFYPQIAGQVELTLVDYKTDTWQDPFGYLWTSDNYNSFVMTDNVPVPMKDPDLEFSVMKRHSSYFDGNIVHEQEKALLIFDASKLISIPTEPWTYDLPKTDAEVQAELDIRIALEADRAEKELQEYFDYIYSGKVQD